MPQNFIVPVDKDSIEMKTAEMLSGVDGAFMYKYTATNEFKTLYIHIWQYREGKLVDRQRAGLRMKEWIHRRMERLLLYRSLRIVP